MQTNRIAIAVVFALNISAIQAESSLSPAEEDFMLLYADEEIIEIATGTAKPIYLAPSVASVITAKDIKASGANTLNELLELVPGLHVIPSYSHHMYPTVTIRGITTGEMPQVLFTVDGIPTRQLLTGARMSHFAPPLNVIERVEIIRGPGSAVHGSDAYAGVINIVTKRAEEIREGALGVRTGSFNDANVWVQSSTSLNSWKISGAFDYSHTDGDDDRRISADAVGLPGSLQTRQETFYGQVRLNNDDWDMQFWAWYMNDAGIGPGSAHYISEESYDDFTLANFDIQHNLIKGDDWSLIAQLSHQYSYGKEELHIFPAGVQLPVRDDGNIGVPGNANCPLVDLDGDSTPETPRCLVTFDNGLLGAPGYRGHYTQIELTSIHHYDKHTLRLSGGVAYQTIKAFEEKNFGPGITDHIGDTLPIPSNWPGGWVSVTGTSNIYLEDQSRNNVFFSAQDEWRFANDWELTGGVRYDHYSDSGTTFNPRLALVWATDYNWTTKFLFGSAFRAPSFQEEYLQNNPVLLGSTDLEPERIHTAEIAIDYRPNFDLQDLINIYYYEATDLIDYASVATGLQARNLNNQKGYGLELESNWKATDKLKLMANFAWQHAEDMDSGEDIPYIPQKQLSATVLYQPLSDISLYGSLNWVMDRQRQSGDTRSPVDDYKVVNIALNKSVNESFNVQLSVHNIFDEDVREPTSAGAFVSGEDYLMEGRAVFIGIDHKL